MSSYVLGYHAALAAYTEGQEWLQQALAYLTANRDFVVDYVTQHLPGVKTTAPEATYLAWLDCRDLDLEVQPHEFFLDEARVSLSNGEWFGAGGAGHVRLNFATSRAILTEALERMKGAVEGLG